MQIYDNITPKRAVAGRELLLKDMMNPCEDKKKI